jgi:hypothetical protein
MVGTEVAQLGPSAHVLGYLIFYSDPVGTPLQNWHNVPIMLQATAGQEFESDIYSFKANATLAQADEFYAAKSSAPDWSCTIAKGYGGTGSGAYHSIDFMCKGFTFIATSLDNDTSHVLVVINKSP